MKRCTKCKTEFTTSGFHKNRNTHDGLSALCKICARENTAKRKKRLVEEGSWSNGNGSADEYKFPIVLLNQKYLTMRLI